MSKAKASLAFSTAMAANSLPLNVPNPSLRYDEPYVFT